MKMWKDVNIDLENYRELIDNLEKMFDILIKHNINLTETFEKEVGTIHNFPSIRKYYLNMYMFGMKKLEIVEPEMAVFMKLKSEGKVCQI